MHLPTIIPTRIVASVLLLIPMLVSAYSKANPEQKQDTGIEPEPSCGFVVVDSSDFTITQQFYYTNPHWIDVKDYEGPVLDKTYIDEGRATKLCDLQRLLDQGQVFKPDQIPDPIDLSSLTIVLIEFENEVQMPVIQTKDGSLFSFLVEEGILGFDCRRKNLSTQRFVSDTVEIMFSY